MLWMKSSVFIKIFSRFSLWYVYLLYYKWCEVKKKNWTFPIEKSLFLERVYLVINAKKVDNLEYLSN